MSHRFLSAHYVFSVSSPPLRRGVLEIAEDGRIVSLRQFSECVERENEIEFFDGVLVPGFVNTHCHLELSYLRGKIPRETGHEGFIERIVRLIASQKVDYQSIYDAVSEMREEGIVAVGDISNGDISVRAKQYSDIFFMTFVEIADFFDNTYGVNRLKYAQQTAAKFENVGFAAHAPYTCSPGFVAEVSRLGRSVFSIHNQEARSEDEMYLRASGDMFNFMSRKCRFDDCLPTKTTSLAGYLPFVETEQRNILLVHNTFTSSEDIRLAEKLSPHIYWCLCPLSNLYIQNARVDANLFRQHNCKITLGTDSLASNERLSILEEMRALNYVEFEELLSWATLNGSKALSIEKDFGSFEEGKQPGVNLITNFDLNRKHLTPQSRVQKIV